MKALLLGSIGVIAETSELQRQAYNRAFAEQGLDWYWSVANYCEILKYPGGKKRLASYSNGKLSSDLIDKIHYSKETFFEDSLKNGLVPREGLVECIDFCLARNIKIGLVTTTTQRMVNLLAKGLENHLDFNCFDIITTKADVVEEKPSGEVYRYAARKLGVSHEDAVAVEDTEVNQEAALQEQIFCYLYAGEYATTRHNLNAIKTLAVLTNQSLGT